MPTHNYDSLLKDAFGGKLPSSATTVINNDYAKKYKQCKAIPGCEYSSGWYSLAAYIVESFGIPVADDNYVLGGPCQGYDMKMQDAYSMIKLSLAYGLLCGQLWECYVNEYGKAEFIIVGEPYSDGFAGELGSVYLSMLAINYTLNTSKVLLTGYKPAQKRRLAGPAGLHELAASTNDMSWDQRCCKYGAVGDGNYMGIPGGYNKPVEEAWRKVGFINWDNTSALEHLFNVGKDDSPYAGKNSDVAFEKIADYAYRTVLPNQLSSESTTVSFTQESSNFVRYSPLDMSSHFVSAWEIDYNNETGNYSGGKILNEAPLQPTPIHPGQWLGAAEVYVYGVPLERVSLGTKGEGDLAHVVAYVEIPTLTDSLMPISRGQDYIVVKDGNHPSIVFSNYVKGELNMFYSNTSLPTYISKKCLDANSALKDGTYISPDSPLAFGHVFPTGNGESGYFVGHYVVVSKHLFPAIHVQNTAGELTLGVMGGVDIKVWAIVITDAPAPIVFATSEDVSNYDIGGNIFFKGNIGTSYVLDQKDIELDDDPFGDLQQFWNSEVQAANESLGPGDIKLTLPFFDVDQLQTVATNILKIAQEGKVEIPGSLGYYGYKEVMFTCGPDSHPRLGQAIQYDGNEIGKGDTYYVNEINYSYQDGSQYVVNVKAGAKWVGSMFGGGWGESLNQLKVENVTRDGRVVAAGSTGAEFVVNIDGFGSLACVNTTGMGTIISTGDTVKVTIYNVPQGEV